MAKPQGKKSLLIIFLVIILLSCCCLSSAGAIGGYFWYKNREREKDKTTQDDDTSDSDNEEDKKQEDEENSLLYRNEEYGFSIELEPGWEDYYVDDEESFTEDIVTSLYFFLPSESEGDILMFYITIYTPDQWEYYEEYADILDIYVLEETDDYIYTFVHLNAQPPEDLANRTYDFDNIMASFELL